MGQIPTDLRNDVKANLDAVNGSKFYCTFAQCQERSFKNLKDLKRHMKIHDPHSTLWFCGCCDNMGHTFVGKERKDKVQSHIRNRHDKFKSEDSKVTICQLDGCHKLFTAPSCLDTHLERCHSHLKQGESRQNATNGMCMS